jgi:hypothetical protein
MIRVAYFDLGFSKEQYGLQPTRYGGGGVAARYLKEDPEVDFHVFAPAESFENMGPTERHDRCTILPPAVCEALQRGAPLDAIWQGGAHQFPFDLILHPHTCATINRGTFPGAVTQFCGFDGSAGHPANDYVLLYDDAFKPQFGERPKYVRIGKPVPAEFTPYSPRESFVFQCSRHDDHMNTISVAKACLENGIKGVFAGPIHNGYPLLDYIDGKTTVYLGEISEAEKLDWCRRAWLFTLNHAWPGLPFNQSTIEAQGCGTPIWVNGDSLFFSHYLKHGVNGWDSRRMPLHEAFSRALDQKPCWEAAREYDVSVMCSTFKQAFQEIVTEWRALHP